MVPLGSQKLALILAGPALPACARELIDLEQEASESGPSETFAVRRLLVVVWPISDLQSVRIQEDATEARCCLQRP